MKRYKKDRNSGFSTFTRYFRNEMSGRERNAFERELQKDPFMEEAAEGFSSIEPLSAQKDLEKLRMKLNRRTGRHNATILYRIAASVAVLLVISSVFILLDRRTKEYAESPDSELKTLEIAKADPYFKQDEPEIKPSTEISARNEKEALQGPAEQEIPDKDKADTGNKNIEAITTVPDIRQDQAEAVMQRRAVAVNPDAALARPSAAEKEAIVRGRVISTEDDMPVPGATVNIKGTPKSVTTDTEGNFLISLSEEEPVTLVASFIGMKTEQMDAAPGEETEIRLQPDVSALSEVVVVGYGTSKKAGEGNNSDYIAPEPAGGRAAFDKYVESNIRRPDSLAGQRVVVVAGLKIKADGTADSIRIIRSPDSAFSREAIRLIKEGPAWKPAMQNGTPVDDEVRIRIVFR